jgi:hypothetical protein
MTNPSKRSSAQLLLVSVALLWGVSSCEAVRDHLYSPKIEVKCDILRGQCRFRNFGDPGEECVTLEVFHRESGRVMPSRAVCSGHIERESPVTVEVEFDGIDPVQLCMGDKMERDFSKNCDVTVVEGEKE